MNHAVNRGLRGLGATAVALGLMAGAAAAQDAEAELVINGETEMSIRAPAPDHLGGALGDEIYSGWLFRTAETRELEMDDFDNPGMIFVDQAAETFATADGSEGKACADCHESPEDFAGLRATLPKWNEKAAEVWTMEMFVNDCRENRMGAEPWGWDSQDMKNMTALISVQSRGMPMKVAIDGPAQTAWEKGREIYYTRYGQLELACANCHEDNYGNHIRADHLSQGMTNGFPVYRLKQANLVSQHNRFRGCVRDTRAETFGVGSPELVALELYVASRGNGLSVEAPSVRN